MMKHGHDRSYHLHQQLWTLSLLDACLYIPKINRNMRKAYAVRGHDGSLCTQKLCTFQRCRSTLVSSLCVGVCRRCSGHPAGVCGGGSSTAGPSVSTEEAPAPPTAGVAGASCARSAAGHLSPPHRYMTDPLATNVRPELRQPPKACQQY